MLRDMSGINDDVRFTLVVLFFSVFSMVVLNQIVGTILFAYGIIYLIALKGKPVYAYQWDTGGNGILKWVIPAIGIVAVTLFIGEQFLSAQFSGSTINLYSTTFQHILTIDHPLIRLGVWGVVIPILETMFFLGVVLYLLNRKLNVTGFRADNINVWVSSIMVGAFVALFHVVSQLLLDQLLFFDMIFFTLSAILVINYGRLREAGIAHILLNTISIMVSFGWLPWS